MIKKISFLFFALFVLIFQANAQKALRIEYDMEDFENAPEVIPAANKGFFVMGRMNERSNAKAKYRIDFYHTDLRKVWSNNVDFPFRISRLLKVNVSDTILTAVFECGNSGKTIIITRLGVKKGLLSQQIIEPELKKGRQWQVGECYFLKTGFLYSRIGFPRFGGFAAAFSKHRSNPANFTQVMFYSYAKGQFEQRQDFLPKGDVEHEGMFADSASQKYFLAYTNYNINNRGMLCIREFTEEGFFANEYNVGFDSLKRISKLRISKVGNNDIYITGTWFALSKPRKFMKKYMSNGLTQGFFMIRLTDGKPVFSNFYKYTQCQHFNALVGDRIYQRIKKKDQMNNGYSLNMRLHDDVFLYNNQLILMGETFYETYRYEMRPVTRIGANGYSYMSWESVAVFDGYQYTHSLVASISLDGKLMWDNSFEISDYKSFQLQDVVKTLMINDEMVLIYSNGDELSSKIIEGSKVVEDKSSVKIPTANKSDEVKTSSLGKIDFWYDRYFIASGIQRIKNPEKTDDKRRTVFYINKLGYK